MVTLTDREAAQLLQDLHRIDLEGRKPVQRANKITNLLNKSTMVILNAMRRSNR